MLGAEAGVDFLSRCRRSGLRLELGRKHARGPFPLRAVRFRPRGVRLYKEKGRKQQLEYHVSAR